MTKQLDMAERVSNLYDHKWTAKRFEIEKVTQPNLKQISISDLADGYLTSLAGSSTSEAKARLEKHGPKSEVSRKRGRGNLA